MRATQWSSSACSDAIRWLWNSALCRNCWTSASSCFTRFDVEATPSCARERGAFLYVCLRGFTLPTIVRPHACVVTIIKRRAGSPARCATDTRVSLPRNTRFGSHESRFFAGDFALHLNLSRLDFEAALKGRPTLA